MSEPLTYAKVDGPPDDWQVLRIFNVRTGDEMFDVCEVNAAEGWLIRAARNDAGELYLTGDPADPEIAKERVEGHFEIRRPA